MPRPCPVPETEPRSAARRQPPLSVFDRSTALHHTGDDPALLDDILRMFLEQGPLRMAAVESALAEGSAAELERQAHGLKGVAAMLGMEALRAYSLTVERLGAEGRTADAGAEVAEMRVAMDAALAAVRKELP
ncbi:MAG: Hpt domain-containing protein [Gemmatimonadetes bacterium]|nr:Hpt domain-containing protein [Gemmatimonadota bacterium]